MKKKYYCTFDTETVGGASKPLGFYHLGGIIHERDGKIIGCFNYLIAEWLPNVCTDKYAKKSLHRYLEMLKTGEATLITTEDEAISAVDNLLKHYNVLTLCAFNSGFDLCKTKCKALLENREFIDLWHSACETIAQKKSYYDFCITNNLVSRSGSTISTNAESFYAYLTDNPNYKEEHTALEDSKIELTIFVACMKTHKKFTPNIHHHDAENWRSYHKRIKKGTVHS